jgi:hypothetical protein
MEVFVGIWPSVRFRFWFTDCAIGDLRSTNCAIGGIPLLGLTDARFDRIEQKVGGIRDDRDWYFWQHRH